jgi:DHA1 family bicyclomycin/chloramphenicol resistance-like MFS transporter
MSCGRAVQAAGSAAALTLTRTVIHDAYGREHSTRVLAHLTTVMILVPMLAPGVGGVLLDHVGWRAVFALCLAFGVVALSLLAGYLPETHRERAHDLDLRTAVSNFGSLLGDRGFLAPALFFSCMMAAVFVTQAAIPYLVVEALGGSATEYGLWFGVACACYVAGNQFTAHKESRIPPRILVLCAGAGCAASAIAGMIAVKVFAWSTGLLFAPTMALYFFAGIAVAPVQAKALVAQPARSGTASGLLSALQMAAGAAAVQAIGFSHDGTPYPLFAGLIACTAAALGSIAWLYRMPRQARSGIPYPQRAA